ncbi:hypothetical protein TrCOL_g5452 [Triparma columacea]|uniref:Uncharacterized protein n=1 Tax=Triparma columacea TaxID=722753 RepID=A0A9W7GML9_9STRA|nr:hypothetical protein TrCOL_g5452 [Triparma columacea]
MKGNGGNGDDQQTELNRELNNLLHYESTLQSELSLLPTPSEFHDHTNDAIRSNLILSESAPEEEETRLISEISNLRTLSSHLSTEISDASTPTLHTQLSSDSELLAAISSPPPRSSNPPSISQIRAENALLLAAASRLTSSPSLPLPPPSSDPRTQGPLHAPSATSSSSAALPPAPSPHLSITALRIAFSQPTPTFPVSALQTAVPDDVVNWLQDMGIIELLGDGTCKLNYAPPA